MTSILPLERLTRTHACAECRGPLALICRNGVWLTRCSRDRTHTGTVSYRQIEQEELAPWHARLDERRAARETR